MCIGKALTGGYMTFSAVLTDNEVADVISNGYPVRSCTAPRSWKPLGMCHCSGLDRAVAFLRMGTKSEGDRRTAETGAGTAGELPQVADVRVLGAIGVIEVKEPVDMAYMQKRFVEEGVWVRPFGKLVYIMPPFIIQPEELSRLTHALVKIVGEL